MDKQAEAYEYALQVSQLRKKAGGNPSWLAQLLYKRLRPSQQPNYDLTGGDVHGRVKDRNKQRGVPTDPKEIAFARAAARADADTGATPKKDVFATAGANIKRRNELLQE